jgi:hypothetical protein
MRNAQYRRASTFHNTKEGIRPSVRKDMARVIRARDIIPAIMCIKPSKKFGGVGVFALRKIKKGTILCDVQKTDKDFFVSWSEYHRLDTVTKKVVINFCAQDKDGYYGPLDLNYLPIPLHMNHSCVGNVGCDNKWNLVAIHNVKVGEELYFDYALVISNPTFRLKCRCKSVHCRRIITGNDWMDPMFIKKNYKYMSPIQRNLVDKI